jgi:hypothetical protein
MHGAKLVLAVASVFVLLAAPLQAQSAPGVVTSWTPFLGCWSTSSSGSIGPMVCVVPGASREQVEFMTVDGDSVVGRSLVDASGKRIAALRAGCTGWEQGTWASDGQRLLMHAVYRCKGRVLQRSDAILSLAHADAFTHVERNLSDARVPARIVHFIVQLDTTVFPSEVRRRLPHLRPLAVETAELESMPELPPGVIVEAASNIDPGVVQAWLADRGQLSADVSATTRLVYAAAQGRELPQPFASEPRGGVRRGLGRFGVVGLFSSALPVYLTADHGNRPEPIGGVWAYWNLDNGYDPTRTIGVPFRWP